MPCETLLEFGPSGLDLLIEVAHDVALRRGRLREAVVVPRGAAEVVGSCAYELNVARLMMHALSVQVGTDKGVRSDARSETPPRLVVVL